MLPLSWLREQGGSVLSRRQLLRIIAAGLCNTCAEHCSVYAGHPLLGIHFNKQTSLRTLTKAHSMLGYH